MNTKTYRAEIISNQSVQDDIIELLEQEIEGIQYTVLPDAQGRGGKAKKLGDTVWPEMNFVLFCYVDLDGARKIKAIFNAIKEKFPQEGMSLFFAESAEV
ncbi:MAG: hypothetical protein MR958_01895 [Spirochaetia bacterium]|nr:hypothetical protein [Spirochaetia bacterium]